MKVTVTIFPSNTIKTVDIAKGKTVEYMIRKINLKPDGIIVLRDKTPIPIDESLEQEEHLQILKVASGG